MKRKKKPEVVVRAHKCPSWPRCACVLQGYVNLQEPSYCGRKPTRAVDAKVYYRR